MICLCGCVQDARLSSVSFIGQVPSMFKTLAPMTEKPLGSWILHFVGRADQFDEWCDPDRGEPPVLWLAGLHIPASYLTALVQQACRIRGWPLDKSTLSVTPGEPAGVTKATSRSPPSTVPVSAVFRCNLCIQPPTENLEDDNPIS